MHFNKFIIPAICIVILFSCQNNKPVIHLPAIISDNMVLQQEKEVVLWGKANPGSKIVAESTWKQRAEAMAGDDSCWSLRIMTPKAGGPYEISFRNKDTLVRISNVLIGEVWLCSGQSNMEMPLAGWPPNDTILNSAKEIADANYNSIRMFTVQKSFSVIPETDVTGSWQVCSPSTAGNFSATAYFFGLKLHQELNVPVGLIHSSWGGTPVESWISVEKLTAFKEYEKTIGQFDSIKSWTEELETWLDSLPGVSPEMNSANPWSNLDFKDVLVSKAEFNDENWKSMVLPGTFENSIIGQFDGAVWFRKSIELPGKWKGKDLMLNLGPIDDMDVTYFNGERVGSHEMDGEWQTVRRYTIPSRLVKPGINVIAVRVVDTRGGGGIYGKENDVNIHPVNQVHKKINLAGDWKILPVAIYYKNTFKIFDIASQAFYSMKRLPVTLGAYTPSVLFNSMINPLVPFTLRGAIWYQGEANVGQAELYSRTFPAMIENWREKWSQGDFPFYFVQIAPFDYGQQGNSAELREAQLKTMKVKNTGMVVTLDIANPLNIHPANKKDVGKRLASWALAKDYGKTGYYSGPIYKAMEIKGDAIILTFDFADNGLVCNKKELSNFEIAGADRKFIKAKAFIDGNTVIVKNPAVKNPEAVRYLWDNTSIASLFNGVGLPASSFRTDTW